MRIPEKLLTTPQVLEWLKEWGIQIGKTTLHNWRVKGLGAIVISRRVILWDWAEVQAWVAKHYTARNAAQDARNRSAFRANVRRVS